MNKIFVPNLGESISSAKIIKWHKKINDKIVKNDPLLELETDKVSLDIYSSYDGILINCFYKVGDVVKINDILCEIDSNVHKNIDNNSNNVGNNSDIDRDINSNKDIDNNLYNNRDSISTASYQSKPVQDAVSEKAINLTNAKKLNNENIISLYTNEEDRVTSNINTNITTKDTTSQDINKKILFSPSSRNILNKANINLNDLEKISHKTKINNQYIITKNDANLIIQDANLTKNTNNQLTNQDNNLNAKNFNNLTQLSKYKNSQLYSVYNNKNNLDIKSLALNNNEIENKKDTKSIIDISNKIDNKSSADKIDKNEDKKNMKNNADKKEDKFSIDITNNYNKSSYDNNVLLNNTQQSSSKEKIEELSFLRKTIAKRLKHSQNTAAILSTFNEVNMTNLVLLRLELKDSIMSKYNVKLSFMSFFIKAICDSLKKFPIINAEVTKEEDKIIYKNYYNINFAISIESGLIAPVIFDADSLSILEIEMKIANLTNKAKSNTLSIRDLTGGTFTVSNGGVFGSMLSTPIINPPQSGILGLHKIEKRAIVINNEILIQDMMFLALSYDHRIIDGKDAILFLNNIKYLIENPLELLLI